MNAVACYNDIDRKRVEIRKGRLETTLSTFMTSKTGHNYAK